MEATATDVSHIAELDARVTVNWCWFPEVFVISENEEPRLGGNHTIKRLHGKAGPSA